ncbi:MAG: hypothetical protein IJ094_08210 [Bacilli bacterium]|nr:hypothetical protein [Bacilli bacterium]
MDLIKIITNIELDCNQKSFMLKMVKNLSRLGHNHIEVNKYIDNIFIHEDKSIEIICKEDINSI